MRVLQICESFGGGNFSSVTQICNGLVDRGVEVHLIFSRRAETPVDFSTSLRQQVCLHEVGMTRSIDPLRDLAALVKVTGLVRSIDPDVVHLHSSKAGFIGRVAAQLSGRRRKVLYSPRGLSFLQRDASPRRRRAYLVLERLAARLRGTVVACSAGELAVVRSSLPGARSILIENAVDVAMIPLVRGSQDGVLRVGTVGRITAARNPTLFADLARQAAGSGVEFVWVGGGDGDGQALLSDAGIRVTGWLTREAALAELSGLDIYVQTSLWEGMPVSVIEAQVAGLPAVVTNILGNRDVVEDAQTGYVCDSDNEMLGRIQQLIGDPQQRRELGRRAREHALRRFAVERMLDELIAAYQSGAGTENSRRLEFE